jgi:hypothetical protein
MAFENFQPLELSENERLMENYFKGFEVEYPGVLVDELPITEAIKDVSEGKSYEV